MILRLAFLGEGKVYHRGEPILLPKWPEGDSKQKGRMFEKYHHLLKLASLSVRLRTINR